MDCGNDTVASTRLAEGGKRRRAASDSCRGAGGVRLNADLGIHQGPGPAGSMSLFEVAARASGGSRGMAQRNLQIGVRGGDRCGARPLAERVLEPHPS